MVAPIAIHAVPTTTAITCLQAVRSRVGTAGAMLSYTRASDAVKGLGLHTLLLKDTFVSVPVRHAGGATRGKKWNVLIGVACLLVN